MAKRVIKRSAYEKLPREKADNNNREEKKQKTSYFATPPDPLQVNFLFLLTFVDPFCHPYLRLSTFLSLLSSSIHERFPFLHATWQICFFSKFSFNGHLTKLIPNNRHFSPRVALPK